MRKAGQKNECVGELNADWSTEQRISQHTVTSNNTLIFFYKHAQPQILGKFKHIAKHAPGWDFQFGKKISMNFQKYANF